MNKGTSKEIRKSLMSVALVVLVLSGCQTTEQCSLEKYGDISAKVHLEECLRYGFDLPLYSRDRFSEADGFSCLLKTVKARRDLYFTLLDVEADVGRKCSQWTVLDRNEDFVTGVVQFDFPKPELMQVYFANRLVDCEGYMPRCFSIEHMLAIVEINPGVLGRYLGEDHAQSLLMCMLKGLQNIGVDNWKRLDGKHRVVHELSARWRSLDHTPALNAEFERLLAVMDGTLLKDEAHLNSLGDQRLLGLTWIAIWGTEADFQKVRKKAITDEDIAFVKWLCDNVLAEERRIKKKGCRPERLVELRACGGIPYPMAILRAEFEQQFLVQEKTPTNVRIYALHEAMAAVSPKGAEFERLSRALDMFDPKEDPGNIVFLDPQNFERSGCGRIPAKPKGK